jgi:uncharacterized protein YbaP (TraB family)
MGYKQINNPLSRKSSPLHSHEKELAAIDVRIKRVRASKEGAEGQGGIDYELLAQLQKQRKAIVESHKK